MTNFIGHTHTTNAGYIYTTILIQPIIQPTDNYITNYITNLLDPSKKLFDLQPIISQCFSPAKINVAKRTFNTCCLILCILPKA